VKRAKLNTLGKGQRPSIEEQERMTKAYQQKIRKSPLWKQMVRDYGQEQAKKMLDDFKVEAR